VRGREAIAFAIHFSGNAREFRRESLSGHYNEPMPPVLPPTSPDLHDARTRPYFLWWTNAAVGDLRQALRDPDAGRRAYWLGALLREANTRDVWLFVTPDEIRSAWPGVRRHLGRARSMWAFLLGIDDQPDVGDRPVALP
jgi:hypothetical protein